MLTHLICLSLIHLVASAQELDTHQRQGLSDTKKLLTTPHERNAVINKDAKAKDVDAKVNALAGSEENKEQIYGLASEVFESIAVQANGDPKKMQQLMLEAQSDPKSFYEKYFTADQKAKLRGLATESEKKKSSIRAPR